MRMSIRRYTRLTNAFSKKLENHAAATAIRFLYYNFARIHRTVRTSPAQAAGVTETALEHTGHRDVAGGARGDRRGLSSLQSLESSGWPGASSRPRPMPIVHPAVVRQTDEQQQALAASRIPQPTREALAAEYRELRMAGDQAGAEAVALRAFRADVFRPVDMVTGTKRSYPMTEREHARISAIREARWDRWLASPGAVRPPRFDDDGQRQIGF
ncbi:MAG: hypothetical protein OXE53_10710 [Deltaproteobacteria bacterium]|nr:hypothetical protein [Deltaproteobacteria bacterium]